MRVARRQIEENPLPFDDPIYRIDPPTGEIFPNSYCELTVAFRPKTAGEVALTAYCELTGREARLPLQLQGQGLGPKATWLYESLDIGDVYVNSEHKYEVVLENHGDIDCDYSLASNDSLFASRFSFTPSRGHLKSRQQQIVEVLFCSDLLGEFNESFVWYLDGQPEPLPLVLKGRVIGPQFHFSLPDGVNFGTVSLGFLKSTPFFLHNAAEIPMRFRLRVPDQNGEAHPEFEIMPAVGVVLPHGKQEIRLDFISTAVQKYSLAMLVDVEAVGDSLLSLPITAECIVPPIKPSTFELEFGDAFVGYTYEQSIKILNPSYLPAKCEVVAAQPMLKTIGEYVAEPRCGIVPAGDSIDVKVKFTAAQLGQMSLPMYVRIVGLKDPAFIVELNANAIGPNVILSSRKVDWGKAQVLTDVSKSITMTNDSLVPAVYKTLLRKADSPFTIQQATGTLAPGECREFALSCHMDDTVRSTNDLIFQIVNAPEQVVALVAFGVGATITASRPLKVVDLGENFSSRIIREEFVLENLGRKAQQLTWTNLSIVPTKEKGGQPGDEKPPPAPVFAITPDKVLMEPGAVCTFTVRAMSPAAGLCEEVLLCSAQVGTAKAIPIFEPTMRSTFIEPLISSSVPELDFLYTYADGDCDKVLPSQKKPLRLTNVSQLPLTLLLKCAPPFAVNIPELHLPAGHGGDVEISFDASYPGDMVSRKYSDATTKLFIAYREHPQKDGVKLFAETQFPNLVMTPSEGAFGCLLNDTQATLTMKLDNPSAVDAYYSWSFAPTEVGSADAAAPDVFFDLLPIRGMLAAGAQETVEVTYRGTIHGKATALALCQVVGGPTYTFPLTAESSAVSWKLDRNRLDFGLQNYDRVEDKELLLTNTGRVGFTFSADKSHLSRKNVVEILPANGTVQAGDKQRIIIRVLPGLPEKLTETFHLQIAHFPPEKVEVMVEGIYPRITLNLPRDKTADNFESFYMRAKEKIDAEKEANEQERLGLPAANADLAFAKLDVASLCKALSGAFASVEELLASWGCADSASLLSRDDFRTLALVVLGPSCTTAAANDAFASLTAAAADATGGETVPEVAPDSSAVETDVPSTAPLVAPLRVAALLKAIRPPRRPTSALLEGPSGDDEAEKAADAESAENGLATRPSMATGNSSRSLGAKFTHDMRSSASDPSGHYRVFVENDVDNEAERLSLSAYAKQVLETHGDTSTDSPPATARSAGAQAKPLQRGTTATSTSRRLVPLLEPLPPPPPGFTLAKYVLDFGNVIKGMQRKKIFRLKNVGWQAVSLDIDKNTLTGFGLRVEPDKVVKLPGLPEPETTEFTVTFASKASKVHLGPLVQELRLDLKPGPPVAVMILANVTLPEVKISEEQISFGNVLVGRCQTHTIVMHNPKEVPAEWAVKPPINGTTKDFGNFVCSPNSGTLAPNAKIQVEVTFTPNAERAYQTQLSFKPSVAGAKATALQVSGYGKELRCVCVPDTLELPPVMPHAAASATSFELKNPTNYPIEVYSVEFDEAYVEEEAMLRDDTSAPTLKQHDALLLRPREPGDAFWSQVQEAHDARVHEAEAEAEAEATAELARQRAEAGEEEVAPVEAAPEAGVGELQDLEQVSDPKARSLLVISAAPLASSAELADKLSFKYQVPVVDLGAIVTTAAAKAADAVLAAKAQAYAEQAGTEGDGTIEADKVEEEGDEVAAALDEEALAAAVASAVSREEMADGCVIIVPEMPVVACTTASVIGALAASLGDEPSWTFLVDLPSEEISARADSEHASRVAAMPPVGEMPDMEEARYEALDDAERSLFESRRSEYRRRAAVHEARVKASEIAHRHRAKTLLDEHESFASRLEDVSAKFAPHAVELSKESEEPESEQPAGVPGVWTVDVLRKVTAAVADDEAAAPAADEAAATDEAAAPAAADDAFSSAPVAVELSPELYLERLFDACLAHLPEAPPPLPTVEPEPDIPLPYTRQIIKRPRPRAPQARKTPSGLELFTLPPEPEAVPISEGEGEEAGAEGAVDPAAAEGGEVEGGVPVEDLSTPTQQTRWVLEPHGVVRLQVKYASANVGKLLHSLRFELVGVGGDKQVAVAWGALCARPSISTDPRNVFSRKVRSREPFRVKKSYVVMRKCFEFGPLLAKRPQPKMAEDLKDGQDPERPHPEHAEVLHISNNSPFAVSVNFSFLADGAALHTPQPRPYSPPPILDSADVTDGEAAAPPQAEELPVRPPGSPAVFFLDSSSMDLEPNETRDLRLSAFPDMDGLFEDNLVCTVSGNPEPVQFPISCIGSTPAVAIDHSEVVFQRMLMGQADTKVVTVSSRSALPVRWAISQEDLATLGGESDAPGSEVYTIAPTSGYLAPGDVAHISVTFAARQAGECVRQFHVEITDDSDPAVLGIVERRPISLTAEAYDIDVQIEWPERDNEGYKGLDFKDFKVVEEQKIPGAASSGCLELVNQGKYEVAFKFLYKSKLMKNILSLNPIDGILPAAENGVPTRTKVEVTFKAEKEVTLRDNTDVRLRITEPLTGEDFITGQPIPVSAHAVFSKYVTVPRGINFGPMVYDTQKERTFELTNTGEFEFDFSLRNHGADAPPPDGKTPTLALGRFSVSPMNGSVPAGGTATITVKFAASSEARPENEVVVIDVSDRDTSSEPDGMMYELIAESCIPGIETTDFVNIFEEQTVNRTVVLAAAGLPSNIFAEDEKLFTFGSHMVGQDVSERFKLTNPFKVPCTVNLGVTTRAPKGGGKPAAGEEVPFDVEPKKLTIPPHEHRYVTCFVSPTAMQTYFATFEANVELGTVPATKQLSFDLMAEGTLPHVVIKPMSRNEEGMPQLNFPKLLVGRSARQQLTLKNEGVLPATVSVSQPTVPGPFSCLLCGQSVSLPSMGEQTVDVVFKPLAAGLVESVINISVHHNDFENFPLTLKAEGHMQQVAFEDLPAPPELPSALDVSDAAAATPPALTEAEDKLFFGDVEVGVPKTLSFTLRNFSATSRRFVWQSVPGITFSPSSGHLLPNSAKVISATFACSESLEYDAEQISLELTNISFPSGKLQDWDTSMTVVKYLTEEEYLEREAQLAAASAEEAVEEGGVATADAPAPAAEPSEPPSPLPGGSPSRARRKVVEVEVEPEYEEVPCGEGEEPEAPLPLAVSAKCHYASVECESKALTFKPTMMFQVRQHSFQLVNTSGVALHYRWKVTMTDGGREVLSAAETPFSASPSAGTIPANGRVDVTVSFSPPEADAFHRQLHLVCNNLAPDVVAPIIALSGKAMRPYCHFEVEESDYVRAGRRSPDMPGPDGSLGPLDPATKVVEFNSLGTRVRNTKRFFVINPTNKTYEFFWVPAAEETAGTQELTAQPFRCQTRKGTVLAGRKYEMVFHFTPEAVALQESHWRFQVPELNIDVPFLLVGTILEPGVSLDRTRHNFGPLLIGQGAREKLNIINTEHLPFSFAFEKASFVTGSGGGDSVIAIEPSSGVVGPHSSLPIEVTFTPTLEKQFNFNIELRVRNKPQPLVLNVKGEGYAIHDTLHLGDANGKLIEISHFSPTRVDFGMVHVNDKIVRQLQITNSGRFNFDINLSLKVPPGVRMPPVAVTPELATVGRNQKLSCQLAYSPTSDAALPQGLALLVQVTNGRSYTLQLTGRGKRPRLSFLFTKYDFGSCFVVTPKNGMAPVEVTLTLVNEDENEIYFDAAFDEVNFLTATVGQTTIAPLETVNIKLAFAPPSVGKFTTKLPFLINGLYMQSVTIMGEGCDMRLELADPAQQQLNLGPVALNQSVFRSVGIVNRSRRPVDVSLADAAEKLRDKSLLLAFAGGGVESTLRPREPRQIELRFMPGGRIPPFSEPVVVNVCGLPRALFQISAACVAMDLQLEMEHLSFGQATLNSRITRPLMLQNRGDIPSTWKMDKAMLAPDFSVSPLEGYLQPNEDTNIEITFHPQQVNRDIRYERVPLYVEGQAPLSLTLTGMCVEASAETAPLVFKTQTRVAVQQKVSVKNPSTGPWSIKPVVQDEQWTGPEILEVPPGQSADYTVTYCPLAMTKDGEKHHGSIFLPLADGSAILYSLEGEAEPPQPADNISKAVACKQAHAVELEVSNWLKQPQRFRVDIRPAEGTDPSTNFSGHEHVDVPAGQSRLYRMAFYAFKEGTYNAEVHFINDKTGEYIYYKLSLKAEAAGVLDSIALQAPLRQLTSHMLPLSNPLPTPVTFTASVNNPEVSVPPSLTVDANSKAELPIEWRPLLPKETTSQLTLQSAEVRPMPPLIAPHQIAIISNAALAPYAPSRTSRARHTLRARRHATHNSGTGAHRC